MLQRYLIIKFYVSMKVIHVSEINYLGEGIRIYYTDSGLTIIRQIRRSEPAEAASQQTYHHACNFHSLLLFAILVQVVAVYVTSLHLAFCVPLLVVPFLVCRSVNLFVHPSSCLLDKCPAHLHFISLISSMMSLILVCCLMLVCLTLSCAVDLSILFSI